MGRLIMGGMRACAVLVVVLVAIVACWNPGPGSDLPRLGGAPPAATAEWARSVDAASGSVFNAVAHDASGNAYAVGYQFGASSHTYQSTDGPGVSATGSSTLDNALIVKYNSAGAAQWTRTTTAGTQSSLFQGISIAPSGELYAVGYQAGNQPYEYGPGVSATSTSVRNNVVIVRFEP